VKVLTVIGNRPQFIKAAAVSPPLRRAHEEILIHTGQHFDDRLSAVFSPNWACPRPTASSASISAPPARRPRACWRRWSPS
jgi:UDP-N-acetylglucosamine 2-epimerase (non-hydrolysing)/UDP-GlcNAc3NAcA epimerase